MVQLDGRELELKFTYGSLQFMQDFEITAIEEVERKPFKMIYVVKGLLLGALNHNPAKEVFSEAQVDRIVEESLETGTLTDLLAELLERLQDSSFFKSLQKTPQTPKKRK